MVTDVELEATLVVIAKVAVVVPASTSRLAGTCAKVLLLDNVTVAPPAGATPLSVTVPTALFPPTTVIGVTVTEDRIKGGGKGTGVKMSAVLFVVLL